MQLQFLATKLNMFGVYNWLVCDEAIKDHVLLFMLSADSLANLVGPRRWLFLHGWWRFQLPAGSGRASWICSSAQS